MVGTTWPRFMCLPLLSVEDFIEAKTICQPNDSVIRNCMNAFVSIAENWKSAFSFYSQVFERRQVLCCLHFLYYALFFYIKYHNQAHKKCPPHSQVTYLGSIVQKCIDILHFVITKTTHVVSHSIKYNLIICLLHHNNHVTER